MTPTTPTTTSSASTVPASARLVHETIADVAAAWPTAVAVSCKGETLNYRELDARAERLAERLRSRGAGPGALVGICLDRSHAMIVAMLGIWKTGAAYVPLDPESPAERRAVVLADARPRLVVADGRHADSVAPFPTLVVDGALDAAAGSTTASDVPAARDARPEDLAYVLYTSGSTGAPKGVMVEHGALACRVEEMRRVFGVGPGDRVSQFPSINWDASLFDILVALATGAALHLVCGADRTPGPGLLRFLRQERITATLLPPSVLATLPEDPLPDLRILFCGGEALHRALVERWGRTRPIYNLYGPTETVVWSTTALCVPGEEPTIGAPVAGAYARVLVGDEATPEGEVGEVCIGGAGLARGYLGRPDLTAERFVEDPLAPGTRLYRTGDLGRVLPDGRIASLGRIDRQVKIRGLRTEPAEIEAALAAHPEVRDAAVEPEPDARGELRLVAYVVPRRASFPAPDASGSAVARRMDAPFRRELRELLAKRLPEPMVPTLFVEMAALPLTANGKVDRRALPAGRSVAGSVAAGEAPRDAMERLVAEAWAQALGADAVGIHENFFDLGGHSLLVADVQARLGAALGRDVGAVELFEHPTVAQLAQHLARGADAPSVRVPVQEASARAEARLAARGRRILPRRGDETTVEVTDER